MAFQGMESGGGRRGRGWMTDGAADDGSDAAGEICKVDSK